MQILGYTIEQVDQEITAGRVAYLLHGPKGARYALIRSAANPEMLFVWNDRTYRVTQAQGYGWFTDRNGTLEVWA